MEEEPSARQFPYCRGLLRPQAGGLFQLERLPHNFIVECGGEGVLWNLGEEADSVLD